MNLSKALLALLVSALFLLPTLINASPEEEQEEFKAYFFDRFPATPEDDFINGVYSIDAPSRDQWEAIEDFPPYETSIDEGEEMWYEPFANGTTYAECFAERFATDGSEIVRHQFPYFDTDRNEVITLEYAINDCREANGEKPLKYKKGAIAALSAYLAYQSRDEPIAVEIPNAEAEKWYERGKSHFYSKRGQLNLACADCHKYYSGMYVRADRLSPAYGHASHFPVYRSKWGELGTLHRRFGGCNKQVRAKPFPAQSEEYRALEYFLTYMSNDLIFNGPGARK